MPLFLCHKARYDRSSKILAHSKIFEQKAENFDFIRKLCYNISNNKLKNKGE